MVKILFYFRSNKKVARKLNKKECSAPKIAPTT